MTDDEQQGNKAQGRLQEVLAYPREGLDTELKIEDLISQAIFDSADLMADIYKEIHRSRQIKVTLKNAFFVRTKLNALQQNYDTLFLKFRDKYLLNPAEKEKVKRGIAFNLNSKDRNYSYIISSIVAAMRGNIKKDPKIVNKEFVLMGLSAQQMSYENLIQRLQNGLKELSFEINQRYQEMNNTRSLILNTLMFILTGITVGSAIWTIITNLRP